MAHLIRVVNVRPKSGYVMDASGSVIPSNVVSLRMHDGLRNAVTGVGTSRDPRMSSAYSHRALTQQEVVAAYKGSGLLRKIIAIPALDMVREWRDWTGLDADQAALVYDEEKRLGLRKKIQQAEVLRGLGGGALVLGLPGDPDKPAPTTGKQSLAFIHVVSRWQFTFQEIEDDARLPGFGEPKLWRLQTTTGQQDIHPSRVVPFRADVTGALAGLTSIGSDADAFWGESTVAQVLDAVQDCDTARASFAALLHKARLLRIGIPNLSETVSLPGGENLVSARLATLAMAESIHNASIFDSGSDGKSGETITDASYSFVGAKDIMNAFAEFACAVSDIPATRLLGRAPEGMNSSGDSQQRDWGKKVRAQQTLDLAPCLDRVDAYLVPSSLGGSRPPTAAYDFAPLDLPSDKENAERFAKFMEAVDKLAAMNVMPERALNRGVQSYLIAEGFLPELEKALAEIDEAERYGVEASLDPGDDPEGNGKEADPAPAGAGGGSPENTGTQPRRAANDAAPRTLYVRRNLLNAQEFIAWAKVQGFETTLPADDMHVTVAFSRQAVDWLKVEPSWDGDKGELTVPAGGARLVEPLGDKGAVVLLFNSSTLAYRHEAILRAGASFDFPEYQPHISITYAGSDVDLAKVEPFRGMLRFGPEIFEELDEDWSSKIEEA